MIADLLLLILVHFLFLAERQHAAAWSFSSQLDVDTLHVSCSG